MGLERPETRYARSGDVHIAYQVVGEGPVHLVWIPGFVSHVEMNWERPSLVAMLTRLASFSTTIIFDKRGTGMSDPVTTVPTLEERMDDVRAVLDDAGIERAAIVGISEGAPLGILFAAAHPERVTHLVLYGGMARSTEAPDYPWAAPRAALLESAATLIQPAMADGGHMEVFAPSLADDPVERAAYARYERFAVSPSMMSQQFLMFLDIDVRAVLPAISVPTLVVHRRGDRVVNRRAGQYLAEHIPGARYVELPGIDHVLISGEQDRVLDEIEESVTGTRRATEPERVLATVVFTDLVGSTARAAAVGDAAWRATLDAHDAAVRAALEAHRGIEIKTLGDGFLATFDGPARAVRCGQEVVRAVRALGLDVRVGIHTGECAIRDGDVEGIAVHVASRIVQLAAANEILVSSTVRDLVAGSGLRFDARGEHTLKGLDEPWRLFAAT
jgi:class 3 adenylate cyclase